MIQSRVVLHAALFVACVSTARIAMPPSLFVAWKNQKPPFSVLGGNGVLKGNKVSRKGFGNEGAAFSGRLWITGIDGRLWSSMVDVNIKCIDGGAPRGE